MDIRVFRAQSGSIAELQFDDTQRKYFLAQISFLRGLHERRKSIDKSTEDGSGDGTSSILAISMFAFIINLYPSLHCSAKCDSDDGVIAFLK